MYESPLTRIMSDISSQIVKNQEDHLMCEVRQSIGYDIDKEELLKALQYDRNQYEKGYNEALAEFKEAITDSDFLKLKYGIDDIDIHFITSGTFVGKTDRSPIEFSGINEIFSLFSPKKVIEDYNFYKHSIFCE